MFIAKKAAAAATAVLGLAGAGTAAAGHATRAFVVATVGGANHPLDSVPDPSGRTIYFSTNGPDGPGIFRVSAAGGPATPVRRGAPLVDPVGLVVSADGRRLYVADPGADRILVVPVGPGRVGSVAGSRGTHPRGLDLQVGGGSRRIVFPGRDPSSGRPAVLALAPGGARRPTVLAEGAPLTSPEGVAVGATGAVYVSDRGPGGRLDGRVWKIAGGRVTRIAGAIRLGDPAGLALTLDQSALLVSSLDPRAGTAQVLRVETDTLATTTFNAVIGRNKDAGGLHRGLRTTVMAWADTMRSGRVYRVDP